MGYTHYWAGLSKADLLAYELALRECRQIVATRLDLLCDEYDTPDKPVELRESAGLFFNGKGAQGCETFCLFLDPRDSLDGPRDKAGNIGPEASDFQFCKTRLLPYDVVVTACLAVLAQFGVCRVSSDGTLGDWKAGCDLATSVLGRTVPPPFELCHDDGSRYVEGKGRGEYAEIEQQKCLLTPCPHHALTASPAAGEPELDPPEKCRNGWVVQQARIPTDSHGEQQALFADG